MRPSIDPQPVPPPAKDPGLLATALPAGIGLLVGAGVGVLLGRTWLAPKPPAAPPATSRINPGGGMGIKGALFQDPNVFDAPGLKDGAVINQMGDCWTTLLRLYPSERASILWQWWAENFTTATASANDVLAQLYALRWDAEQQACGSDWRPSDQQVAERLRAIQILIGFGSVLERALCQKVADYAAGRPTALHDFHFDCAPPSSPLPGTPLPPPVASPKPNILLTDFDACQRAFAALSISQQGWVADEMLRRFGFSGYVQLEGDPALEARLREISQAAQVKVGAMALQPKAVNARLRALRVALNAAGQDRRDAFCQLVADAPRAFNPGGALGPLAMSFPSRR